MPHAIRILTIAALLCAIAVVAQAKNGQRCSFIGGYAAAETPELLAQAQARIDVNDDDGLTRLRALGKVFMPQDKPAENVQCGADDLCQATLDGKRLWRLKNGLQCP